MLSDAFKPAPVKDDDGNEVVGLFQIKSQKVNKVGTVFEPYLMFMDALRAQFLFLCCRTRAHPSISVAATSLAEVATMSMTAPST